MYWQLEDVHNEAVYSSISRNDFEEIILYLHLANNANLKKTYKFAKVRTFLDFIKARATCKHWRVYGFTVENMELNNTYIENQ